MKYKVVAVIGIAIGLCLATNSLAGCMTYSLHIDTSGYTGTNGRLAFELTSSTETPFVQDDWVSITDYFHDGHQRIVYTFGGSPGPVTGGPVGGRIVSPHLIANSSWIYGDHGFLNGMTIDYDSLGTFVDCDLELMHETDASHPSQFSAFYLGGLNFPIVETSDPLGANALFTVTTTPGCEELIVYDPAVFTPPSSITLDLSNVTSVSPEDGWRDFRVISVGPNPTSGGVWIRFESPPGDVQLRVYDIRGALVHEDWMDVRGKGESVVGWSGEGRSGRVSSGVYFAQLTGRGVSIVRSVVVVH